LASPCAARNCASFLRARSSASCKLTSTGPVDCTDPGGWTNFTEGPASSAADWSSDWFVVWLAGRFWAGAAGEKLTSAVQRTIPAARRRKERDGGRVDPCATLMNISFRGASNDTAALLPREKVQICGGLPKSRGQAIRQNHTRLNPIRPSSRPSSQPYEPAAPTAIIQSGKEEGGTGPVVVLLEI
jgi:hypothetical protein